MAKILLVTCATFAALFLTGNCKPLDDAPAISGSTPTTQVPAFTNTPIIQKQPINTPISSNFNATPLQSQQPQAIKHYQRRDIHDVDVPMNAQPDAVPVDHQKPQAVAVPLPAALPSTPKTTSDRKTRDLNMANTPPITPIHPAGLSNSNDHEVDSADHPAQQISKIPAHPDSAPQQIKPPRKVRDVPMPVATPPKVALPQFEGIQGPTPIPANGHDSTSATQSGKPKLYKRDVNSNSPQTIPTYTYSGHPAQNGQQPQFPLNSNVPIQSNMASKNPSALGSGRITRDTTNPNISPAVAAIPPVSPSSLTESTPQNSTATVTGSSTTVMPTTSASKYKRDVQSDKNGLSSSTALKDSFENPASIVQDASIPTGQTNPAISKTTSSTMAKKPVMQSY